MEFVLVDDGLTASHTRQRLAAHSLTGVKVGNFNALLETLAQLWLLPPVNDDWAWRVQTQALAMPKAFWAKSIQVDEAGTLRQIDASLRFLLDDLSLNATLTPLSGADQRPIRYYNDLVALYTALEYQRPAEQMLAQQWLARASTPPLEPLTLLCHMAPHHLTCWQREVVDSLMNASDDPSQARSAPFLAPAEPREERRQPDLARFTANLFEDATQPIPVSHLHWLSCRDAVEEVEAVTAMIQSALAQGTPAEAMAIMYPHDTDYPLWLERSFTHAGLALSNSRSSASVFDWQRALLHDLLDCRRLESPTMAWMSVLANPLMPWSQIHGHYLAQRYDADRLEKRDVDEDVRRVLDCLLQPVESTAEAVLQWLDQVIEHCTAYPHYGLSENRLANLLDELRERFALYASLAFDAQILRVMPAVQPGTLPLTTDKTRWLQSVTLFSDRESLPFDVAALFVVGFNQGHYTFHPRSSGALERTALDNLAQQQNLPITRIDAEQVQWQTDLRQQLERATDRITFTLARQSYTGDVLDPSESLLDMALCIQGRTALKPEQLITPIHQAAHPLLSFINQACEPPASPTVDDLAFNRDLLQALESLHGERRHASPTSLEFLMVSPLYWLLDRLRIQSKVWGIETLDILLQGTIAHRVFELFKTIQDNFDSPAQIDALFKQAVEDTAPFLLQPQWRFEYHQLQQQVFSALNAFAQWCRHTGWRIDKVERYLNGELFDWPVRGIVDVFLKRQSDVLILDYKKSKSQSRLKRLEAGYDLQTWVYRELYQQSHPGESPNSGYYNLNDETLVLDYVDPASRAPADLAIKVVQPETSVPDQSASARYHVKQRLEQVRAGHIALNQTDDVKAWEAVGVNPSMLTDNAFIKRFIKPDEEAGQ